MRVLIVYKSPTVDNPQASHDGMGVNTCNTAKTLRQHGIQAEGISVIDGYDMRDKLRDSYYADVTHVVMSAPFFDTDYLRYLCGLFPQIKFTITFHSNVGFLGLDSWAVRVIGEELSAGIPNFIVSANSHRFHNAVEAAFDAQCALLPNLYLLQKKPVSHSLWDKSSGPLRIGVFGATRVLKNLPTAAWAAQIIARKLDTPVEFWVSAGRQEGPGAAMVLEGIKRFFAHHPGITLVENDWQPWEQFRRTIGRMHLNMQLSYSESFNIVVADSIAEGVPAVVGPAIAWVPPEWTADADDACSVAAVGVRLLRDASAPIRGWKSLERHNEAAVGHWRAYLDAPKPGWWARKRI